MKKIIYVILGIFLMVACTDDHLEELPTTPTEKTGEKVKVTFSVQIPEAQTAVSRSFEEPAITSLHLAVFDANGYLSEVVEATNQGATELGTAESPIPFEVELSQTPNKRIIHFLANKTIDANDFGTENELIGALYTTDEQDAYWQRIELNEGISFEYKDKNESGSYDDGDELIRNTIGDQLTKVPLIRNFAKITVQKATNMTTAGGVDFKLLGFTVVNVPDRGSVAPIKTNGGGFAQYLNASKVPYNYNDLTNAKGYIGFVPSETQINAEVAQDTEKNPFLSQNGVFYMYERNNQAKNANRTFVIIKGKFGNEDVSYYKVDLTYKDENVTKYFEILRNFSYNIVIKNVESSGATSPGLAAEMTGSHNNLSASIETQSLLNISDGAERLFVNYTEYVFVSSGEEMVLKYRYVPNISQPNTEENELNDSDNDGYYVSYSLETKENAEMNAVTSITPATSDDSQGWRTLTVTAATMDPNVTKSQILTLVAGNLSRTVKFILRPKYNFSDEKATSPTPINTLKSPFVYSFTIPENIAESLFPLTFIVKANPENIYPNADLNSLPVKVLDGEKTFGYERTVTLEEYKQTGGIINCYFRVNTASYANPQTQITVSNKYFNDCTPVTLNNNNTTYAFSNLIVNGGEAVPYGAGRSVTFSFDMPYIAEGGTEVTITANKMSAMSKATTFTYTATQIGRQEVIFTTAEFASADRIMIEADNYITGIQAYDNVLKIKAKTVTGTTTPELGYNSNIRVYASESDAKVYGDNHLAQITRSTLLNSETTIALTGLTEESLVWFAYEGTDRIYVASATAGKLADATADIAFSNSYEKPLIMSVTYGTDANKYGNSKSFQITFKTNKSGTYNFTTTNFTINNKNGSFEVAAGEHTFDCTSSSWNGQYSITIDYQGDNLGGEDNKTWTGPERTSIKSSKDITISGLNGVNNTATITIYKTKSENTWYGTTYTTFSDQVTTITKSQLANGEFEMPIDNNTVINSTKFYFVYNSGGTTKYAECTIQQLIDGETMNFSNYSAPWW